ncbi:MAG: class II aldolase/adducin family protein, partial [Kyrpidia sp.]|nr:class II aldolase/adducin family protein [Kyrpidia sp.]
MPDSTTPLRKAVLEAANRLSALGLVKGTAGNVSARIPGTDRIVITPSGVPYDAMELSDLVEADLSGTVTEGIRKPSSETPLHTRIYLDHPWVGAIVHTHSLFATTFAVLNE